MKIRDALELLLLAALWGASFLFLRVAAPLVGPLGVAAFRVAGAALVLWPLVLWRGEMRALSRRHIFPLAVFGLLACVLPFLGFGQAAKTLPAGLMSVLNAVTPLWGAAVGWLWRGETLTRLQVAGLALGLGGVMLLASGSMVSNADGALAVLMVLGSTLMYAVAVHHSKAHLSDVPPIALTTGSLTTAAIILSGPAWWLGPQPAAMAAVSGATASQGDWAGVPALAWAALLGLAVLCTALAYWLFYRLIARIGATRSLTVAFLIPVFGMLWGALLLGEAITARMLTSTAIIVLGTWLSTRGPLSRLALPGRNGKPGHPPPSPSTSTHAKEKAA